MKHLLTPLCLLACCGLADAAGPLAAVPARNWSTQLFTKEGFHSMTARGSEVRKASDTELDVVDLNLTVFCGDATNRVETIILSPAATFFPKQSIARGDRGVRLIRDDLEAAGTRWTYEHAEKKVSLHGQVRIVINAEFKDLLK